MFFPRLQSLRGLPARLESLYGLRCLNGFPIRRGVLHQKIIYDLIDLRVDHGGIPVSFRGARRNARFLAFPVELNIFFRQVDPVAGRELVKTLGPVVVRIKDRALLQIEPNVVFLWLVRSAAGAEKRPALFDRAVFLLHLVEKHTVFKIVDLAVQIVIGARVVIRIEKRHMHTSVIVCLPRFCLWRDALRGRTKPIGKRPL